MPQYEFGCLFCEGITSIYLYEGDKLNYRALRCEFCGEKQMRLNLYCRNTAQMIRHLQDQVHELTFRIEELESDEESGHSYESKQ